MNYQATAAWLRPRLWMAVAVGAVPWLAWLVSIGIGGWKKDSYGQLVGTDHLAFYHAARLIRDGQEHRIYSYVELNNERYQQQLIGWDWGGFDAYRNPPFYALLYVPTAGLSYYQSYVIWTLIGFGLLWFAIKLLRPERPGRVFLWSLTFYPIYATTSFGQNTFISLAIFAAVYRLISDQRMLAAGLVAGLLWYKPQLLLGLFVWWAMEPRRYFRCWVGCAGTGAVLAAVSLLVVPDGSRAAWDHRETIAAFTGDPFWNKHSPRAFFALLMTRPTGDDRHADDQQPVVMALAAVCSLAGIALAWWVKRRTGAPVAAMFPVAVFLSLWASPHSLIYEWGLAVAAGCVLWERYPQARDVWLCLFALAWLGLGVATPLAWVQIAGGWPVVVQVSVPVMGLVGWRAAKELVRSRGAHDWTAGDRQGETAPQT